MINPKKRKSGVLRSVSVEAEHIDIPSTLYKGLVAYRVTYTESVTTCRNGRTNVKEGSVWSKGGVCMKGELDKVLAGKTQNLPEHATVMRDGWHSAIQAVKPEYLEVARKVGWYIDDDTDPYGGLDEKDPITALENGEDVRFIECHGASHQLFDLKGNALPVALNFNYIDGGLSEDRFDLVKAAEILMKRDDVILREGGGERYFDWRGDANDPERFVGRIPHYNAERGRSRCLAFRWHPTEDDYATAFALAHEKRKGRNPNSGDLRWVALFDADVFGLVRGGAAHFSTFTKTLRDHNPDGSRRRRTYDYGDDHDCY
jgi:hypothetical protein